MSLNELKAALLGLRDSINERRAEAVLHIGLDMPHFRNRHELITLGTSSELLEEAAGSLLEAEEALGEFIGHLSRAIEKYDNYIALR